MNGNNSDALLQDLLAHETSVWTALKEGDKAADLRLLHSAFLGVYADGFAGRTEHAEQLDNGPSIQSFALSDTRAIRMGAEHALLSYRAEYRRQNAQQSEAMYVSSVWCRTKDGWVNVFSQDTVARD